MTRITKSFVAVTDSKHLNDVCAVLNDLGYAFIQTHPIKERYIYILSVGSYSTSFYPPVGWDEVTLEYLIALRDNVPMPADPSNDWATKYKLLAAFLTCILIVATTVWVVLNETT